MERFRLLDLPPMTAAENMALDETLLELKGRGEAPNTIRFLRFAPRAVLVGMHQAVAEEVNTGYCRAEGIQVNRRITGGGAIFFDESHLGWEIVCDKRFPGSAMAGDRLYRRLCRPVVEALGRWGLAAAFRPRNDIEINGRKVSGTGGTESEGAFLFQGTLLVDLDTEAMLRSLRVPVDKLEAREIESARQRVTCMRWELGYVPPLEEIKTALRETFERCLAIRLEPGGLTAAEAARFHERLRYFESRDWIDPVRGDPSRAWVVRGFSRNEAGSVRFALAIDRARWRLRDVYITGDFLATPARAVRDLEAALRGVPLDPGRIRAIVLGSFETGRIHVQGMGPEAFLLPLERIFEQIERERSAGRAVAGAGDGASSRGR